MSNGIFYIPEILENILLYSDPVRVLIHRRVCKTWQTVISTSPHLKYLTRHGYDPTTHQSPQETPVIHPIAFQILTRFWERIAPYQMRSKSQQLKAQHKIVLRSRITKLLTQFLPICQSTPFLREGLSVDRRWYLKCGAQSWNDLCHSPGELNALIRTVIPNEDDNSDLVNSLEDICKLVYDFSPEVAYEYRDGVAVELEPEKRAHMLFRIRYKVDGEKEVFLESLKFGTYPAEDYWNEVPYVVCWSNFKE
ncbi:hypothetical protein ABW20_dc0109541 [Dactylellina cionopaga]|nr:hypothetical protein ABW20_dc0109541 [Dactylellina cionopaga]